MRDRTRTMLERVGVEALAALGADGAALVHEHLGAVLAFRDARIVDDHDTRLLHPARTIRILLSDGHCTDAVAAAAAARVETFDYGLRAPGPDAGEVAAFLAELPAPGGDAEETLERLVTASPAAALVALCERLDHVRHAHLRPDVAGAPLLEEVRAAWIPAAGRIAPDVARRFSHWADAFERRLVLRRADLP